MVRACGAFNILTWKCALRHNGVHFFDIATSKSGPALVCFVHFDFEICFASQPRALFPHLNFQKWSDPGVSCTFWLGNALRATTACNFSPLIWPDGPTPDALARSHKSLEKQGVSRLSYLFAHLGLLSSEAFSFLVFSFSSLLFSDSSSLCFSSAHIVGSLTSKLPWPKSLRERETESERGWEGGRESVSLIHFQKRFWFSRQQGKSSRGIEPLCCPS